MKYCPNCNSEVEDNFELCWNCSYSFSDAKVVNIADEVLIGKRVIDCLRCKTPMYFTGNYRFHEGSSLGFFGNLFEAFVNKESFDVYSCPECGKVEFFLPQNN